MENIFWDHCHHHHFFQYPCLYVLKQLLLTLIKHTIVVSINIYEYSLDTLLLCPLTSWLVMLVSYREVCVV